jgi:hypothetical protein
MIQMDVLGKFHEAQEHVAERRYAQALAILEKIVEVTRLPHPQGFSDLLGLVRRKVSDGAPVTFQSHA